MMKMNLFLVLATWVALIATVSVSAKDQGLRGRDLEVHNEPDASDYFEGEENLLSLEEMDEMGLEEEDQRDLTDAYGYGNSGYGGGRASIIGNVFSTGYGSGYGGYGRGSGYGSAGYGSGYGGYGRGNGYGGYGNGYGGYGSGYGSSGYGSGYGGYGSGYGGYGSGYGSSGY